LKAAVDGWCNESLRHAGCQPGKKSYVAGPANAAYISIIHSEGSILHRHEAWTSWGCRQRWIAPGGANLQNGLPMKTKIAALAMIAMASSPAWALSLDTQENYPGAGSVSNYEAGGYTSRRLGGSYTVLTPVTGAGRIVDDTRPSITVRQSGSPSRSLPPLPSSDTDGSRAREWLLNQ